MVVALLALTIGGIAVFSTRVVHEEIRKFEIDVHLPGNPPAQTLRRYYAAHRSWDGVAPVLRGITQSMHGEGVLFDAQRRLAAATIRGAHLEPDDKLVIVDGNTKKMVRGPQPLRDDAGNVIGYLFLLPAEHDQLPPGRSLDRAFLWIFSAAALVGIVLAVAIARWITVPVERLTEATRRMERGDLSVRVEPRGGPELSALAHGFNAMAAALDRNEEQRRRMVSDVAHELRAPLTNIRCELESMQDGLSTGNVASLHEEVMHLARLVDDLQDLSLAEAGALDIAPQPVAVAALVRRLNVAGSGPEDLTVMADPTRTVQILTNLLTNAQRYSDDVRVQWQRDGDFARIDVVDQGPGIPPDHLPHVFDRFYRVDASRARHTGGAGLGLSIVKQLVQAQGGRVWAESAVGEGSTFSFTLPRSGG
jgi:two-component system sensor histidine kinase BaeS